MARRFITIPSPKGGIADSLYEDLQFGTYQNAKNLNLNEGRIVRPIARLVNVAAPSGDDNDFETRNIIKGSDGLYYIVGLMTVSASNTVQLYSAPSLVAAPSWTQRGANITSSTMSDALEEYKDGVFFAEGVNLYRWGDISGSPSRSTISTGLTANTTFIRENKGLGLLFIIHNSGKTVASYDNSTITVAALTLTADETAVGLEAYGRFNVIGVRQNSKADKFYIWDGSATTVDDVLTTDDVNLRAFRVIGSRIHYLTARDNDDHARFFRYYQYPINATEPTLIKEFPIGTTGLTPDVNVNAVDAIGGRFQFAFEGHSYQLLDNLIWEYGSENRKHSKVLRPLRTDLNNETSDIRWKVVKNLIDRFVVVHANDSSNRPWVIEAITNAGTFDANGLYESNAFALNPDFPGLPAQIKRIYFNHQPIASGGSGAGFTASIKLYGNYPHSGTIKAEDSFTNLTTAEGSGSSTGATQSTANAQFTEVADPGNLEPARYAQLRVALDEISGINIPDIIFPIHIEVETDISRP